ncbi:penicillin-binding protein [Candidatus Daviesbacteria bacterium]|nr:penicillin-binding protein [Candidatus Daviesbacteria bacterium]
MPKEKIKNQFRRSPLAVATLLVVFLIIKIGNGPLRLLQSLHPRHIRGRPKKRHLPPKVKFILIVSLAAILFINYTSFTLKSASSLPSPTQLVENTHPLTTEIYDRKNQLLFRLYEGRNRTLVKLEDLPPYLAQATIAIEDKNFFQHGGFDLEAIFRALIHNLKGGELQGASTITQQLIKNTLLTPEKTYTRKLKEIFLAFWAERIYSKKEILQMYLNEAPYGGTAWGIEAGAQTYFGKQAKNLTLAEAAFLAGLPASPTEYNPNNANLDKIKLRQKEVLRRMVEDGYITKELAEKAILEPLDFNSPTNSIRAPHFVMYVKELLSQKYGPRVVSQGGLKIYTTLDLKLQEKMQKIVKEEVHSLLSLNVTNGALMITDAPTGQILSLVGSRDYYEPQFGNFNVTTALRQPGSAIKVLTYATAFKKGFSPGNTILDTPVSFKDGSNSYSPQNYDNKFHGPVSIRVALASSYNVPAVKMLATVGIEEMIKTAQDMGITTLNDPQRYGLSLTLGGGEVKMIDMMAVYGTLSQQGFKKYPTPILKVTDSSGNILEEYEDHGQQVLSPEIAYLITHILSDNLARSPAFGPNSLLYIPGFEVAAKTGTSDNKRDNWAFGYTQRFVVGVWVGNNNNSPMNPLLTSGVTGAAPIWNKIMHELLDGTQNLVFEKPAGIIEAMVDGRRDLTWTGVLPKALVRFSQNGDQLIFSDNFSTYATPSAKTVSKDGVTN